MVNHANYVVFLILVSDFEMRGGFVDHHGLTILKVIPETRTKFDIYVLFHNRLSHIIVKYKKSIID